MEYTISVIVPAYNEERSIAGTVSRIKKAMEGAGLDYELVVVDDGSKDSTGKILAKAEGIKVITHEVNLGYGASIKDGIRRSGGELIVITDADGTYPVDEIPKLVESMPDYDMVVGVRDKKNVPLVRRPAKLFLSLMANFLSAKRIPDLNSGLRVFRRELAEKFWNLFPDGFSFTTTITMAALTNSYRVKFTPIRYFKREGKSSIHPIRDTVGFFQLIFRLSLYFNPLKVFIPLSLLFFIAAVLRALRDVFSSADQHIGNLAIVLFFMSFQLFFFGLIADIINKK